MSGDLMKGDLVRHATLGLGRVEESVGWGEAQQCSVHFPRNGRTAKAPRAELSPLTDSETAAYEMVLLAVRELEREETPAIEMGERWKGGEFVLKPRDPALAAKGVPIENFFHKIVMVRDRLRVMEQQINTHKGLSDQEKVELQQYVTRIYGSLTTFNILFKDKKDHFVGQKGE